MKLTKNEILRTAFKRLKGSWESKFGRKHPEREMCVYCKGERLEPIRDEARLTGFQEAFSSVGVTTFTAYDCPDCGAVMSVYDKDQEKPTCAN